MKALCRQGGRLTQALLHFVPLLPRAPALRPQQPLLPTAPHGQLPIKCWVNSGTQLSSSPSEARQVSNTARRAPNYCQFLAKEAHQIPGQLGSKTPPSSYSVFHFLQPLRTAGLQHLLRRRRTPEAQQRRCNYATSLEDSRACRNTSPPSYFLGHSFGRSISAASIRAASDNTNLCFSSLLTSKNSAEHHQHGGYRGIKPLSKKHQTTAGFVRAFLGRDTLTPLQQSAAQPFTVKIIRKNKRQNIITEVKISPESQRQQGPSGEQHQETLQRFAGCWWQGDAATRAQKLAQSSLLGEGGKIPSAFCLWGTLMFPISRGSCSSSSGSRRFPSPRASPPPSAALPRVRSSAGIKLLKPDTLQTRQSSSGKDYYFLSCLSLKAAFISLSPFCQNVSVNSFNKYHLRCL